MSIVIIAEGKAVDRMHNQKWERVPHLVDNFQKGAILILEVISHINDSGVKKYFEKEI
ncbi:MAG: hypothetical protein GX660_01315 [Clostridiaceae bacterium]|nr:hypothetical protein [Clostridiaceae bacterium]